MSAQAVTSCSIGDLPKDRSMSAQLFKVNGKWEIHSEEGCIYSPLRVSVTSRFAHSALCGSFNIETSTGKRQYKFKGMSNSSNPTAVAIRVERVA